MNWPNRLTTARLVMTFIFVGLFALPQNLPWRPWDLAMVIAVIAASTDYLDGYIARKYQLITDFGKLMDPLADKIFVVAGFVVMTEHQLVNGTPVVAGWITILILAREFAVTGLRAMAAQKGFEVAVSNLGKWKTTVQMLVLAVGGGMLVGWIPAAVQDAAWFHGVWYAILFGTVYITAHTGLDYFIRNRKLFMTGL